MTNKRHASVAPGDRSLLSEIWGRQKVQGAYSAASRPFPIAPFLVQPFSEGPDVVGPPRLAWWSSPRVGSSRSFRYGRLHAAFGRSTHQCLIQSLITRMCSGRHPLAPRQLSGTDTNNEGAHLTTVAYSNAVMGVTEIANSSRSLSEPHVLTTK